MNWFALSKNLSLVAIVLGTWHFAVFAEEAKTGEPAKAAPSPVVIGGKTADEIAYDKMRSCSEAIGRALKAKSKFMSACKSGGSSLKNCSEILDDCESNASIENMLKPEAVMASVLGVQGGDVMGGGSNKCSEYSYTDYKSELKDLERERKDAQKQIQDLQKEKLDADKDLRKGQRDLQKEVMDAQKDYAQKELDEKEKERDMKKAFQDQERETKQKLRDLQKEIMSSQNEKAVLIASRAGEVEKFQFELSTCQIKAEAEAEAAMKSLRGNTSAGLANKTVVGNVGSAMNLRGQKKVLKAQAAKICMVRAVAHRNAEAQAYQSKLQNLEQKITSDQAKMQEEQVAFLNLSQQFQQAALDRMKKKGTDDSAFQAQMKLKTEEMQALLTEYQNNQSRIAQAAQEAQSALNQASNKVTTHQKEKPLGRGSKSKRDEMRDAQADYVSVSCKALCTGVPSLDSECDKVEKAARDISAKAEADEDDDSSTGTGSK